MGLSDEERYRGMVHSVNNLYKLRGFSTYLYKNINKLLNKLWADFLGNTSNSIHWILGSDSSQDYFENPSLLSISFEPTVEIAQGKREGTTTLKELHEEFEKKNPEAGRLYKFLREFTPSTEKLLSMDCYNGKDLEKSWKVIQHIEQYFYYVNRYNDKFSKNFKKLTDTICEIRGILFDIMYGNESYFRAFAMAKIIDRCLLHEEKDIVSNIFMKQNMHHDMRLDGLELKETYELFKEHQTTRNKPWSAEKRMLLILKIMGPRNHYEHQHKEIAKHIEDWNKNNPKNKIDLKKAKDLMEKSKKLHDKNEKETKHRAGCYLTGQDV